MVDLPDLTISLDNPASVFREEFKGKGIPVYGITGRAGCGKSTFAAALGRGRSHTRLAFADPLREVALAIFGCAYRTQEEKAATDAFWSERLGDDWSTGRKILQRLGTEVGRQTINTDIWLHAMDRRLLAILAQVKAGTLSRPIVTIEDVRFANEAKYVHDIGGTLIHLERSDQPANTDTHASEGGIHDSFVDHHYKPESVEELERIALAHSLCAGV
jgi:hypothetical protein